jgi:amino acid transporter
MDIILAAFIGYALGAVGRTSYDYLFKILDEPSLAFDREYVVTMLVSIILSILTATITFSAVPIPDTSWPLVMFFMATEGFMLNHLINKPVTYLSKIRKKTEELAERNG